MLQFKRSHINISIRHELNFNSNKKFFLINLSMRAMHHSFVCENATFISKNHYLKGLTGIIKNSAIQALMEDKAYIHNSFTLNIQRNELSTLKKKLSKLQHSFYENQNEKNKITQLLMKKKLEELEYEKRLNEEKRLMILKKKIKILRTDKIIETKDDGQLLPFFKKVEYTVPPIKHGFSGFVFSGSNNKCMIAFAFHSSKEKFKIFDVIVENVKIDEEINPIKYINPIHIMELDMFKLLFKTESPLEMINKPMFRESTAHDMIYCAYRAALKSIQEGNPTMCLFQNDSKIGKNKVLNAAFVSDEKEVFTPAQIVLKESNWDISESFKEEITYAHSIKEGKDGKIELLEKTSENFNEFF